MTQSEFISACVQGFSINGMTCSEAQAEQLWRLTERMLTVNKSMNLTAITDENAIILRHYVDSLMISASIPQHSKVIDVGCGAGFPTLPLAIFRPDLQITALDGTAKRIRYVEETAAELGLANVTAVAGRAEECGNDPGYRQKFDVVAARAVANLQVLCELCLPFAKVDGCFVSMKSKQAEEEVAAANNCIKLCGGKLECVSEQALIDFQGNPEDRRLVHIKKISPTPKIYPRHFSKISKKPL